MFGWILGGAKFGQSISQRELNKFPTKKRDSLPMSFRENDDFDCGSENTPCYNAKGGFEHHSFGPCVALGRDKGGSFFLNNMRPRCSSLELPRTQSWVQEIGGKANLPPMFASLRQGAAAGQTMDAETEVQVMRDVVKDLVQRETRKEGGSPAK